MPLGKDQEMPAALLPLEGQGLPPNRPNLLLSILVLISIDFLGAIPTESPAEKHVSFLCDKVPHNLGENQTSETG